MSLARLQWCTWGNRWDKDRWVKWKLRQQRYSSWISHSDHKEIATWVPGHGWLLQELLPKLFHCCSPVNWAPLPEGRICVAYISHKSLTSTRSGILRLSRKLSLYYGHFSILKFMLGPALCQLSFTPIIIPSCFCHGCTIIIIVSCNRHSWSRITTSVSTRKRGPTMWRQIVCPGFEKAFLFGEWVCEWWCVSVCWVNRINEWECTGVRRWLAGGEGDHSQSLKPAHDRKPHSWTGKLRVPGAPFLTCRLWFNAIVRSTPVCCWFFFISACVASSFGANFILSALVARFYLLYLVFCFLFD